MTDVEIACEFLGIWNSGLPCPPLTDELAMRMLRELSARDYDWELSARDSRGLSRSTIYCLFVLDRPNIDIIADDPAEAIVKTVAALMCKKKP
jgi:hypothetical protein